MIGEEASDHKMRFQRLDSRTLDIAGVVAFLASNEAEYINGRKSSLMEDNLGPLANQPRTGQLAGEASGEAITALANRGNATAFTKTGLLKLATQRQNLCIN